MRPGGPCHALGGAGHRCDGPARHVVIYWTKRGDYAESKESTDHSDDYRFCPAAIRAKLRGVEPSDRTLVSVTHGGYVIEADPRGSHGYCYLVAYPEGPR